MYVKLCIDGMTSKPFSAKSLDIRYQKFGLKEQIIAQSREQYGMDKEVIEDKVKRWSEQKYSDSGNRSLMDKGPVKHIEMNVPAVMPSTDLVKVIDEPEDLVS
jgi:hypothetical protein